MNVKKLCRRGIDADHEEDHSGIISVESSVYYCLLFLDPPLVLSDLTYSGPRQPV